MRTLRIVSSDGTPPNTIVVDEATGEQVKDITRLHINDFSAFDQLKLIGYVVRYRDNLLGQEAEDVLFVIGTKP